MMSSDISFGNAFNELSLSIDQIQESAISTNNNIGSNIENWSLRWDLLKPIKVKMRKTPIATLFAAYSNGMVTSNKRVGKKELLFWFSFFRFCQTVFKEL